MLSLKIVCLSACLLVFCPQNIEAKKCNRKTWSCPNTTININVNNQIIVREAQRELIKDALTSPVLPKLPEKSQKFINKILDHVHTDSPTLLKTYYGFVVWILTFLANSKDTPSLCLAALNINSSVTWKKETDGNVTAAALREASASIPNICTMLQTATLHNAGCEELPPPVSLSPRCYKRGTVYQINEALDLFGAQVPCCLYVLLIDLYNSDDYLDNLVAISFILALTPEYQCLLHDAEINVLLEALYMYLHNDVSVCCCNKRRARYDHLCSTLNATTYNNVETVLREVYLINECSLELKDNGTDTTNHP